MRFRANLSEFYWEWLHRHGKHYSALKATVLGDDLYCHQPLCQELLAQQFNFILVCWLS